jgi:hypothetical protein
MGLQDVDDKKRNVLIVLIVEGVEGGNLPPEWRSGIATEYQDDRLVGRQRRQLHIGGFVQFQ